MNLTASSENPQFPNIDSSSQKGHYIGIWNSWTITEIIFQDDWKTHSILRIA